MIDLSSISAAEFILSELDTELRKIRKNPYTRSIEGLRSDIQNIIGKPSSDAFSQSVREALSAVRSEKNTKWAALNAHNGNASFGLEIIDSAYGKFVSVMAQAIDVRKRIKASNKNPMIL